MKRVLPRCRRPELHVPTLLLLYALILLGGCGLGISAGRKSPSSDEASAVKLTPGGSPDIESAAEPCPESRFLVDLRAHCGSGSDEICAWLPILEDRLAGRRSSAIRGIEQAFDVPPATARRIEGVTSFLLITLLDKLCRPDVFDSFFGDRFPEEEMEALTSPVGLSLLLVIMGSNAQTAAHFLAAQSGTNVGSTLRALTTFGRLLERSEEAVEVLSTLRSLPLMTSSPTFPPLDDWPSELDELADPAEEIDRALEALDGNSIGDFHRLLDQLTSNRDSIRDRAVLSVRAGVGLMLRGLLEESALALLKAEQAFQECRPWDAETRFVRVFGGGFRTTLAIALGRIQDGDRIHRSLYAEESGPLERWLLDQIGNARILVSDPSRLQELRAREMARIWNLVMSDQVEAERGVMERASLLALPGLAGSARKPVTRPDPDIDLVEVMDSILVGNDEEALRRWVDLMEQSAFPDHALWPILIAEKALKRGDLEGARRSLEVLLGTLERSTIRTRSDDFARSRVDRFESRFYSFAVELSFLAKRLDEAFAYAERGRAFVLRRSLGMTTVASAVSENEIQLEQRIVERELGGGGEADSEPSSGELREKLAALRFERQLLAAASVGNGLVGESPVTVPDLSSMGSELLHPNETLISYFTGDRKVWAWVVRPDGVRSLSLPWGDGSDSVRLGVQSIQRRRGAILDSVRPRNGSAAPMRALYDRLIAPVSEFWQPGDRLIIAPHGSLHGLPWAALESPGGRLLVEDHEIAVIPSVGILAELRRVSEPATLVGSKVEALVLGNPETHLESLSEAGREARVVAELLGADARLRSKATEASVLELADTSQILHMAAHGIYEADHPLFSRLQLAAGGGEDGFLHVYEILDRLDLRAARLVVLSACRTAAGRPTQGDDIVGLTQAFLEVGSPSVISTLWPVDDPATARLMVDFYRRFRAGKTAGTALREAQLALRSVEPYREPFYWAGFVLFGDPLIRLHRGES